MTAAAQARLEALLAKRSDLWRGRGAAAGVQDDGIPSGFQSLDRALVQGGWPRASLCEILTDLPGIGLSLFLPALARLSASGRWLLMVAPPMIPYPPALAASGVDVSRVVVVEAGQQRLWAIAQGLESGHCAMVLGWLDRGAFSDLRRLQVLAAQMQTPAVLFRPDGVATQSSPAGLRLQLRSDRDAGVKVIIIKQQGGLAPVSLTL